jgi:GntR family transcriptional regulator/MocR family aminotransferase
MAAPAHVDTEDLAQRLHTRGVVIEPGHAFFETPTPPRHFYRLAYSSIDSARIAGGIAILAEELARSGPNGAG